MYFSIFLLSFSFYLDHFTGLTLEFFAAYHFKYIRHRRLVLLNPKSICGRTRMQHVFFCLILSGNNCVSVFFLIFNEIAFNRSLIIIPMCLLVKFES